LCGREKWRRGLLGKWGNEWIFLPPRIRRFNHQTTQVFRLYLGTSFSNADGQWFKSKPNSILLNCQDKPTQTASINVPEPILVLTSQYNNNNIHDNNDNEYD
jgi:hypothetical protein